MARKHLSLIIKLSLVFSLVGAGVGCVAATSMPSFALLENSPKTHEDALSKVRRAPSLVEGYLIDIGAPMSFGSSSGADYSYYQIGIISKSYSDTLTPEVAFIRVFMTHTQYQGQGHWNFPDRLTWRDKILKGSETKGDVDCGSWGPNTTYCNFTESYDFDLSIADLDILGRWGGEMVLVGQDYTERLVIPSYYASALSESAH